MPLYKYLPEKHVESFLDGHVFFRPLAYFRQLEESGRGDPDEAARVFRPAGGLEITRSDGDRFLLPASFRSEARAEELFVFCVSRDLDPAMGRRDFKAEWCVEIADVDAFVARLKASMETSATRRRFVRRRVRYYELGDPPVVDWAIPETMLFMKQSSYSHQREFRFAFGPTEAFSLASTAQRIVFSELPQPAAQCPEPETVKIGDSRDILVLHRP